MRYISLFLAAHLTNFLCLSFQLCTSVFLSLSLQLHVSAPPSFQCFHLSASLCVPSLLCCSPALYPNPWPHFVFHPTMDLLTQHSQNTRLRPWMAPHSFHLPLVTNARQVLTYKRWLFVVHGFILFHPAAFFLFSAPSCFCLSPLSPLKFSANFFTSLEMWAETHQM